MARKYKQQHPHLYCDELRVFFIPADRNEPMEFRVIENKVIALGKEVGNNQLYILHDDVELPSLDCGCPLSMVINFTSQLPEHDLPINDRASIPFTNIVAHGDVLIVGHGITEYKDKSTDVDLISLNPRFHAWPGPGFPVPEMAMPWDY